MKTAIYVIGLTAAALLILFASGNLGGNDRSVEISVPGAPEKQTGILDLSFENYDGEVVRLSDFAGMPMVLNSWAAWCPFCVDELPDFAAAQQEFEGRVVIVSINRQEPLSTAKKFSDGVGVTEDLVLVLDPGDSFYKTIGGFSMPETLFINAAGEIVHHKRGPMKLEEIRQKIQDIL